MTIRLADLLRGSDRKTDGYSRALQVARVRAAYQRSYFAPALFSLVPVETDAIASMAVDSRWRLYYNDAWLSTHTVEENATLLIHEVSHLLRDHETRKTQAGIKDHRLWNTAGDCEINDDLHAEGLPLPGDPPLPSKYGLESGNTAELYYKLLPKAARSDEREKSGSPRESAHDCGAAGSCLKYVSAVSPLFNPYLEGSGGSPGSGSPSAWRSSLISQSPALFQRLWSVMPAAFLRPS